MSAKDASGLTPKQHLQRLNKGGARSVLLKEHEWILRQQQPFMAFLEAENLGRNRFQNLLCYDETRVKLTTDDGFAGDYVHASWVDGYDRAQQYVLAQAPYSDETDFFFWRAVWKTRPTVIVLLCQVSGSTGSAAVDQNQLCTCFWPAVRQEKSYADGLLRVRTDGGSEGQECDYYDMVITLSGHRHPLHVRLMHYREWETDVEVPSSLMTHQAKMSMTHSQQEALRNKERAVGQPAQHYPVMFTCSTGIHRSGTLCALDICLRRLQDCRRVALEDTARELRRQRYGCLQLLNHYLYLTETIVNHAIQSGMVQAQDLGVGPITFDLRRPTTT